MKVSSGDMVHRVRWAAIGAAVAVSVGGGGLLTASATVSTGERAVFVPISPCRVMDTRPATKVGPRVTPLAAKEIHSIDVRGTNGDCTIPTDATGLSLNVTVTDGSASSYLTVFPSGAAQPNASNLNWVAGQAPVPNAVNAAIGADGKVSFFNFAGTVDVIADITGYYIDHNHDDRYALKGLELNFSGAVPASGSSAPVNLGTIGGVTVAVVCAAVASNNQIRFTVPSGSIQIEGTQVTNSVTTLVLSSASGGGTSGVFLNAIGVAAFNGALQMQDGHIAQVSLAFGQFGSNCIAQGTVSPA